MHEEMITEKQVARLVELVKAHGHSEEDAYEALAFVMDAKGKEGEGQEAASTSKE